MLRIRNEAPTKILGQKTFLRWVLKIHPHGSRIRQCRNPTLFALMAAVFLCGHGTVRRKFRTLRAGYKYLQSWGKSDKVRAQYSRISNR